MTTPFLHPDLHPDLQPAGELLYQTFRPGANAAQWLCRCLADNGIGHLFLVPGLQLDPLYAALDTTEGIEPVVCTHELGAGFMADGYGRSRQLPGVAAAIGCVGAGNLLNTVTTSRLERQPLLVFTGDVPDTVSGRGFQRAGSYGGHDDEIFAAAAKFSRRVRSAAELPELLAEAWRQAISQPCGPAHLILSRSLLEAPLAAPLLKMPPAQKQAFACEARLLKWLQQPGKPVLVAGEELDGPQVPQLLQAVAERHQLPVATTLNCKGLLPETHPLSLGNLGYAGSARALGSFSRQRLRALWLGCSNSNRNLLGIGEAAERSEDLWISSLVQPGVPRQLQADPVAALELLAQLPLLAGRPPSLPPASWPQPNSVLSTDGALEPAAVITALSQLWSESLPVFVDSGTHRLFAGLYWQARRPRQFLTCNQTAPMGWALAAAIGNCMARPGQPALVLSGDGCMLMQGLELRTAVRYGLPLVLVVFQNQGMASFRLRQQPEFSPSLAGVDFCLLAQALGAQACRVETLQELEPALRQALRQPGPTLLEVQSTRIPWLPPGAPF
ncbi:MAG TPA: thiamine pyrophosphate-binding protein [Candidatus Obscuribacterales bacterium]